MLSQDGASSLMVASLNGHVDAVDKLLQHGATVDLQSKVYKKSIMGRKSFFCADYRTFCI